MINILYGPAKTIYSLSDVFDIISNRPSNNEPDNVGLRYFYRGHSKAEYDLTPSIARYKNGISLEVNLIEAAKNRLPQEFHSGLDSGALIAKMQHYGLPTRLIDFTINPFVALYFACKDHADSDGEVLSTYDHINFNGPGMWPHFEFISDFNKNEREIRNVVNIVSEYFDADFVKHLVFDLIYSVPEEGIFVTDYIDLHVDYPWFRRWRNQHRFNPLSNEERANVIATLLQGMIFIDAQEVLLRQRLQQGKYLLVPNEVEETGRGLRIKRSIPTLNHRSSPLVDHWIVKAEAKAKILRDLDIIGINEQFLFGDSIDCVCHYLRESVCATT